MAQSSTSLSRFEGRLELLGKESFQTGNEIHDKVKKLHDELQAEQRERLAADDEITALTMMARNLIEKETRERQKHEEEVLKKHEEVAGSIDQHRATRDLAHAGLE